MLIFVSFFLWGLGFLATTLGTLYTYLRWHKSRRLHAKSFPPVSILKPLKGSDSGLLENLESFFNLDYPSYEILFSLESVTDPAHSIVQGLIRKYPKQRARVITGTVNVGPNPKVNNLVLPYEQASHDHILISDSNMRVPNNYLRRVVAHFGPGVGIVTAVVTGQHAQGFGGELEAVYLNTFYARWMVLSGFFRRNFVIGKTMFFRRSTADRFGGLRCLASYVAEDYVAGIAMRRLGLKVALMSEPTVQYLGNYTFSQFWARHLRWGRIRKSQVPLLFALEPFQGVIFSGLTGVYAMREFFGVPPAVFLSLHVLFWFLCDYWMLKWSTQSFQSRTIKAWLCREWVAFAQWVHMAVGNHVVWRGQHMRIYSGGLLSDPDSLNSGPFALFTKDGALSLGSCH